MGIPKSKTSVVYNFHNLEYSEKQIRKKRLYAAALAALIVFVGVFTYFFRTTAIQLIPWQDGLVEVVGVKTYQPEDAVVDDRNPETGKSVTPSPTPAPYRAYQQPYMHLREMKNDYRARFKLPCPHQAR